MFVQKELREKNIAEGSLPLPDDEEFSSIEADAGDDDSMSDSSDTSDLPTDIPCEKVSEPHRADIASFPPVRLSGKRVERVIVLYADKSFES